FCSIRSIWLTIASMSYFKYTATPVATTVVTKKNTHPHTQITIRPPVTTLRTRLLTLHVERISHQQQRPQFHPERRRILRVLSHLTRQRLSNTNDDLVEKFLNVGQLENAPRNKGTNLNDNPVPHANTTR